MIATPQRGIQDTLDAWAEYWSSHDIEALLGISLSAEQRETLEKADVERLEVIYEALCSSRQWPAD